VRAQGVCRRCPQRTSAAEGMSADGCRRRSPLSGELLLKRPFQVRPARRPAAVLPLCNLTVRIVGLLSTPLGGGITTALQVLLPNLSNTAVILRICQT
jgi:hypothetical protein